MSCCTRIADLYNVITYENIASKGQLDEQILMEIMRMILIVTSANCNVSDPSTQEPNRKRANGEINLCIRQTKKIYKNTK